MAATRKPRPTYHITLTNRSTSAQRDAVGAIQSENWDLWDRIKWKLTDDEYQECLDAYDLDITL